jgi:hypothetical protein
MVDDGESLVAAVLEGGPASIPDSSRSCRVNGGQFKIKIRHHGGYEHFERTDEWISRRGESLMVYRWTSRTRVAE